MANYARKTMRLPLVGIVGLPEKKDGRLFNAAAVVAGGEIVGIVRKRTLANYAEYYEKRQFDPAPAEEPPTVFEVGGLRFGVEICEDLWSPIPPSSRMAGVDVVFENVQAREQTQILMDIANQEGALVVGTGDLSEIALGWNTYNGDHMSMYQINASVPKTMVLAALKGVAFRCRYDDAVVERTCETFWRRFFAAQYKRNCVPDGPKITLLLSPRADWRMPSDAEAI